MYWFIAHTQINNGVLNSAHSRRIVFGKSQQVNIKKKTQTSIKTELYKVGVAVIKSTKTRVVVMVTNMRRHPYINLMKSSSDNQKVDVGMSPCVTELPSLLPCFGAFITVIPTSNSIFILVGNVM